MGGDIIYTCTWWFSYIFIAYQRVRHLTRGYKVSQSGAWSQCENGGQCNRRGRLDFHGARLLLASAAPRHCSTEAGDSAQKTKRLARRNHFYTQLK